MKRWLAAIGLGGVLAAGVMVPTAGAQVPELSYRPLVEGRNVVDSCRKSGNVVVVEPFGEELDTGSRGACISTLLANELSIAAYNNNCRTLEREVFSPSNGGGRPYPYTFYGNPEYRANNRWDCIRLLRGFHTGALQPGPPA